jgi:signal transduction histidine kinase
MTFRKIILYLLVLFSTNLAFSQNAYHSTWYSADSNHLPQNSVKSIVADKYGFLWLSTESGIVRYDGRNFRLYNSENLPGIVSDRMFIFSGDVKRDSITIRNDSYEDLLLIKDRKVQLLKVPYPYKRTKHVKYTYMEAMHPYHISLQKEIFKWVADDKYFVISSDTIQEYTTKHKLICRYGYKYPDSTQFFTIGNNLYRLVKDKGYVKLTGPRETFGTFTMPLLKGHKILNNMVHRQVFLLNGRRLFYLTEKNNTIVPVLIYEDFDPKINIHSLYYDAANNVLYLGSANKGFLIVKKNIFRHMESPYKHNAGTDGVYYALTPFNNLILASTGDLFSSGKHSGNLKFENHSDKYCITIDRNGDIWTKTHEKLSRFNKSTGYTTCDSWELEGRISILAEGKDGKIWIGTGQNERNYKGTLYCVDPSKPGDVPKLFMRLDFTPICLNWLNAGVIYVGSLKGLYRVHTVTKTAEAVKGFPDVYVRSLYVKGPHEIWAATYNGGLYLYRGKRAIQFPMDRNKYMLSTHCVMEDRKGYLWLTTNRGIFQARRQDLLDYADGKAKAVYYYHYDKSLGFLNNEFNGGCEPCGIYVNQATMYLPSMDGIVYFNPAEIKPATPLNAIYIDEIDIDGKSRVITDTLHINRNFGRIKIFVSSPYSGNPYNQNFEVKLDGPITQPWLPLADDHITYSTLPPGNYKVTVRKLAGFGGKWMYRTVNFTVIPAFWQQGWFLALAALAGAALLYFAVKLRTRYIRYKNVLLEKKIVEQTAQLRHTVSTLRKTRDDLSQQITNHKKLIKIITHDIKSPLKFMAITGKYLYNKIGHSNPELQDDIIAIHSSSSQLYEFVDSFLEYAKESHSQESEPYLLHELVQEKTELFKNLASAKKTILVNATPPNLKVTLNRHLLSIILHNLTDNAVKHTYAGQITYTAYKSGTNLIIEVKDTGRGMAAEQVQYYMDVFSNNETLEEKPGMGLPMIIELLHIMNGNLNIHAAELQGTTIGLIFPVND